MKKQIRKGVFETNSSSTHSICIAKNCDLIIPENLHFSFGEFGWERNKLDSDYEKASYLYTGLFHNERHEDFKKIIEYLETQKIYTTFEEPIYEEGKTWADNDGYVDHADELNEFLNDICNDNNKLMQYLFSPLSFILTGNDNDDIDVNINVLYDCDEYYKGN